MKEASRRIIEAKESSQANNLFESILDRINTTDYQLHISTRPEDDAWDRFLAVVPGGHHVQTGLWAQLKSLLDREVVRIVVTSEDLQIVAGAQMLVRQYKGLGRIGVISKGPVFSFPDPALEELVVKALVSLIENNNIQYLIVQPPNNGETTGSELIRYGFQQAGISIAQTATVLIDLYKDLDEIMADMNQSTRRNIRIAQRNEIAVYDGTEADLSTFYELYSATSERKDFTRYPFEYYEQMWKLFAPPGYAKLFLAKSNNEIVSTQLAITFGDTVINKMTGWSGGARSHRPNEALYWHIIKWAKAQGFRYYDLEGVNPDAARNYAENNKITEAVKNTYNPFKLGFGGQVTFFPGAYIYISDPVLRNAYRFIFPKIHQSRLLKEIVDRLRTS